MNIAYLDAKKGKRDPRLSITVAFRNLSRLQEYFGGDIYSCEEDFKNAKQNYDVIVCGFGSISSEYNLSTEFINKNNKAKIYWLVGEYEQSTFPPLFYSGREYEIIKNGDFKVGSKLCKKSHIVNFNSLLYRPYTGNYSEKKYDLIYYGRWRKDRANYYKKYSNEIFLSTSSKNLKNFLSVSIPKKIIGKLNWSKGGETLKMFKRSLYIEDNFTNITFNNLANRFYESCSCGVASIFDESCLNTIKKSMLPLINGMMDINTDNWKNIHKLQEEKAKDDLQNTIKDLSGFLN